MSNLRENTAYIQYVASAMPTPTIATRIAGENSKRLIALAHLHIKQVPHGGVWEDDESMSHITGFRMIDRTHMNGRSPDMHVAIGPRPNIRIAITVFDRVRDYKKIAQKHNMIALRLDAQNVPMKILSRYLSTYNIRLPKRKFIAAWPL